MQPVIAVLYGLTSAVMGAAAACWVCAIRFRRKTAVQAGDEVRRASEALLRLQELASRVAFDVDEHSSQVAEINDALASAGEHEPGAIVDVVAKLIQSNQRMHEKLASTEDKLREQAKEIQTHAAEARTDALTLLANRRAFNDELARRFAELRRQGRVFSLIMVDVDHFKKFNDTHGHQVGDEVLRDVAKALRRKMREMDLVARYGGEEFAVILPGTTLDDACKAAARAGEGIAKAHFRHAGKELQVTASLGAAQARADEESLALIARADKALYAAKEGGRNCAYRHDGQEVQRVALDNQPASPATVAQPSIAPVSAGPKADEIRPSRANAVASEPLPGPACADDVEGHSDFASRTAFCQQVRNRTAEWKRGGPTFSVALMEVNQYWAESGLSGRQAREVATRTATRFLAATVREMDVVGHYAPGCYALLLPTAGLADAIRVAERFREAFSQYRVVGGDDQPRLTLSVGVVQVMEEDDSISVLKRAEAALDVADRRGGNRAYYHDGERCAPVTAMLETMGYLA